MELSGKYWRTKVQANNFLRRDKSSPVASRHSKYFNYSKLRAVNAGAELSTRIKIGIF